MFRPDVPLDTPDAVGDGRSEQALPQDTARSRAPCRSVRTEPQAKFGGLVIGIAGNARDAAQFPIRHIQRHEAMLAS